LEKYKLTNVPNSLTPADCHLLTKYNIPLLLAVRPFPNQQATAWLYPSHSTYSQVYPDLVVLIVSVILADLRLVQKVCEILKYCPCHALTTFKYALLTIITCNTWDTTCHIAIQQLPYLIYIIIDYLNTRALKYNNIYLST